VRDLKSLDTKTLKQYSPGPVAGVDEVGMAPLAGPICACALIIDSGKARSIKAGDLEVDDSKKLTRKQRMILFPRIVAVSTFGLGWVSVPELNAIRNLNKAGDLARQRAVRGLIEKYRAPKAIISDFFKIEVKVTSSSGAEKRIPCVHVAQADQKSFVVACASIVAKISRDEFMMKVHEKFPHYGWYYNVGYPTREHWNGIKIHGTTSLHRSYIVDRLLAKDKLGKKA
jgi:ribonuclease HII